MQSQPQAGHGGQFQTSRTACRHCMCPKADLCIILFQGLLVQQQLASGGPVSSLEISNGRHPKLGSIQSTDTVSLQTLASDPSEEAGGMLPTSVSMSRPGSKVGPRVLHAGLAPFTD